MKMVHVNKIYGQLRLFNKRYVVNYGGRRSGKSWAISQLLVRRCIEHAGRRIMVLRKVGTTIRYSTWPRMKAAVEEIIGLENVTLRLVDREIWFPNGSMIGFGSLDDVEKWKSQETVDDYWLEEASEMSEIDFDTLDSGLSSACDPQPSLWLSFNPIPVLQGSQHWLQKRFLGIEHGLEIPAETDTSVVLRTWFKSNKWCPLPTIRLLESYKESNPELWKMWGLGEFCELKGAILHNWATAQQVPDYANFAGYGLDWGYAEDPAAVIGVWRSGREIWLRQYVYSTGLTNPMLSDEMQVQGIKKGVDDIKADSSEPKSIAELASLGWRISGGDKKPHYKKSAALYLQGLKIHVLEDSPDIMKELQMWSWKQDRDGNVQPIVGDGNDHAIDALIYRIYKLPGTLTEEEITRAHSDNPPVQVGVINHDLQPIGAAM